MPTKTISITEEAYRRLKREKSEGESFSDVIIRLTEGKEGDIREFAGEWRGAEDIEEVIRKGREGFDRYAKRVLP